MVSLEEIFACKTQEWKLLLESCGESREWTSINYFLLSSLAWPVKAQSSVWKSWLWLCSSAVVFKLSRSICCKQWQIWIHCFLSVFLIFGIHKWSERDLVGFKQANWCNWVCDALKPQNNGTVNYFLCFPWAHSIQLCN